MIGGLAADGFLVLYMSEFDRLDADAIKANLKTKRIGRDILVYNCTLSTNDIAAEYAKSRKNNGLVIFAEEQTAGKGRGGNKWLSPKFESILCSTLLLDCKIGAELLTLTAAVAVAEAIGRCGSHQARIKWPNDIILAGKKVAGVLLESKTNSDGVAYIIGIGINCHQSKNSFPSELQQGATSIDIESSSLCDRTSLAKRLLTSIDHWLETAQRSSKKVINQWRKFSIQLGHRVEFVFNSRKFTGNCIGIDPEKGLIVHLDTGGTRFFDAAHTTIAR